MSDILDSFKARLYDFKTSPFLATYFLSWIFFNSKLVLIYFDDDLKVPEKIEMLKWDDINLTSPLIIALGYVFVYPIFNNIFYAVKLGFKALSNWIQQKIEDKTPLPMEKAKELKEKYLKLFKEQEKVLEELEEYKNRYMKKNNEIEKHINEQVQERTGWFETEKENLESQLKSLKTSSDEYRKNTESTLERQQKQIVRDKDTIEYLTSKSNQLVNELREVNNKYDNLKSTYNEYIKRKEVPQKYLDMFDDNEIIFLENVYRGDFLGYKPQSEWLSKVKQVLGLPIIEAEKFFTKLSSKKGLLFKEPGAIVNPRYQISDAGKNMLYEMFKTT